MWRSALLPWVKGYIGGEWVGADGNQTTAVIDPATGDHLADVPRMGAAEATRAADAAAAAMRVSYPPEVRREWLTRMTALLETHTDALAEIITREHGKPLAESRDEVAYTAGFFRFFAGAIEHLRDDSLASRPRGLDWAIRRRPAGVAVLITPWNFPIGMLGKKLAPALAAGCGSVTKPATKTPLTTIALWRLLEQAGIPAGMANLVIGDAGAISGALLDHPAVRLVSFTGSTAVGRSLAEAAGRRLIRATLELGGNAPFLVFADADLDRAADALIATKFRAGGQTCVCANRVLVERSVMRPFLDRVVERAGKLTVGNGFDPETKIGPLIDRDGFDKVAGHVRDALDRGATRLLGGDPPRPAHAWGAFYPPTVLRDVTPEMLVCRKETFGPVVAAMAFDHEEEAIALANASEFGLAAYVCTGDPRRGARVAERLDAGHVGLNTGSGPTPEAPFGGLKQSGFGREGGLDGLLEYTEAQVVARG